MVKVLSAFLVCAFLFISLISFQKHAFNIGGTSDIESIQASPTPSAIDKLTVSDYWLDWAVIGVVDRVRLKTNLEEKLSSEETKEKYDCNQLFSGGFYNQEGEYIGLLVEEFNKVSSFQKSPTFNSFFSIDKDGEVEIGYLQPADSRLAIQAGPMLINNGELVNLQIRNDSNSRRIVLAIDKGGSLVFLAIYNKDSFYLGPKLSELPELLKKFGALEGIELVDAMNLDGGSHSAFLSDEVRLSELSTVGSFFCVD